jgi:hypothetical protein
MAVNKTYWVNGIPFRTLAEYVAVRKIQKNFSLQEHLRLEEKNKSQVISEETLKKFTSEETIKLAWDIIQPMTLERARRLYKRDVAKIKLVKALLMGRFAWDPEKQQAEQELELT